MSEKKKLKDTKLGDWFRNKAQQHLDAIGDLVPGGQAVKAIGALIDATTTSDAERQEARAHRRRGPGDGEEDQEGEVGVAEGGAHDLSVRGSKGFRNPLAPSRGRGAGG